jgi:hypothetical protein
MLQACVTQFCPNISIVLPENFPICKIIWNFRLLIKHTKLTYYNIIIAILPVEHKKHMKE